MEQTIRNLIGSGGESRAALLDSAGVTLTYSALSQHIDAGIQRLNDLGLGRGDRVAVVLPNGPAMASAFVTIAAGATIAPLNPSYRYDEFEFLHFQKDAVLKFCLFELLLHL